jgi:hypothetical protein
VTDGFELALLTHRFRKRSLQGNAGSGTGAGFDPEEFIDHIERNSLTSTAERLRKPSTWFRGLGGT